ncbi:MAG TPA: hypothetical protein PKA10_15755 [Selenomonadales bacterium]|nr:hypothetical protein [Selenomonadales bacterium]
MMLVFPVANGILPRPHGGRINGVFLFEQGGQLLNHIGVGRDVLVCPWVDEAQALYPVGVVARLLDLGVQKAADAAGNELTVLMAVLEGRGHARWHTLRTAGPLVVSPDTEPMALKSMRKEYPVISGAGWLPAGGYTEFRADSDIPVTIYGTDLESGREVSISANVGGLVTQEQAHTVEHGIIRALTTYGLCTPRTLLGSMAKETKELKHSVEMGFRLTMPEIIGRTRTGACGNPLTSLAQFYLAREFVDNVAAGKSFDQSLVDARRKAMSQLTGDLNLTAQRGVRALQGLKKGMAHDDTPLKIDISKKLISRFPLEPWE